MHPLPHPNFSFSQTEINALRERIAADETVRARYREIVKGRDAVLAETFVTEEYANSVFDQHGKFGEVNAQLGRFNTALGGAYLIEDDLACAARLRDLLLHLSAFAAWAGPDNPHQEVPRRSELNTAALAIGAAYGYDVLYSFLTPEERETIGRGIIKNGVLPLMQDWVLPETRIHAMDSMGHNWWSVCVALGAAALLPVQEHLPEAEAARILGAAEEALTAFLRYPGCSLFNKPCSYDAQSLFYESVAYFSYGTGELLRYIFHAERYLGRREALRAALPAGLDRAILSFAYPTKAEPGVLFLNYGDSSSDVDVYPLLQQLKLLGYGSPAADAYIARRHAGRSLFELMHPELFTPGSWDEMPNAAFFPQSGYAVLRDGWRDDATLFSVKSGYTWNHAHADAGHFTLWSRGETLLPDAGVRSYKSTHYRTYFCKDEAHNVLLIGRQGQNPEDQYRGNKFPGRLFDTYEGGDFTYVGADATGPLAHLVSRAYRNFIWIENRILVVLDDVRCHTENSVQFLLHNAGRSEYRAEEIPATRIRTEKNELELRHVWPRDLRAAEVTDCVYEEDDGASREAKHLEFSTETPARSHLLAHVFILDPAAAPVTAERLESDRALGVLLREEGTGVERRIWFNLFADGRRMHVNSNNVIDGMETDAYFLMRTLRPGAPERVFLASASYYRHPGEPGFAAFIKTTAEF